MRIRSILSALLIACVLGACASGPQLEKYPRREIDRPYTLPKGVATWKTPAILSFQRNYDGYTSFIPPVPIPLLWQQSLSDDWQLNWFLFVPGLSYQVAHGEWGYAGMSLSIQGIGYGSIEGFFFSPDIEAVFKPKLTQTVALELQLGLVPEFRTGIGESRWRMFFSAAPEMQLTDTLAASLGPAISLASDGEIIEPFTQGGDALFYLHGAESRLLVQAGLSWSLARQWDLRIRNFYAWVAPDDGTFAETSYFELVHFW